MASKNWGHDQVRQADRARDSENGNPSGPEAKRRRTRPLVTHPTTLRTAVACRACRERKTRCSGDQPVCKYCAKSGIECEYNTSAVAIQPPPLGQPSRTLDEWGRQIIAAVDSLAQEMRGNARNNSGLAPLSQTHPPTTWVSHQIDHDNGVGDDVGTDNTAQDHPSQNIDDFRRKNHFSSLPSGRKLRFPNPSIIAGGFSILTWPIFDGLGNQVGKIKSAILASTNLRNLNKQAAETASIETADLLKQLRSFSKSLLPSFPVVEVDKVRRMIAKIGEYGIEWTCESCLVLLIAALGSIYQSSNHSAVHTHGTIPNLSPASNRASSEMSSERLTSSTLRYWNMARKRLTWAMTTTGFLAAQCQFLAGLYLIHSSESVAACKMLTGALASIHEESLDNACDSPGATNNHILEQDTRLATLKLLLYLRCEVELPCAPSSFNFNFPGNKPDGLPIPNDGFSVFEKADAEILCIRAHALADYALIGPEMSVKDIYHLLHKLKSFLSALNNWHSNLAPHAWFPLFKDLKTSDSWTATDDTQLRMQHLYYETEELILRPVLFLLLHSQPIREAALAVTAGVEGRTRASPFNQMLNKQVATQFQVLNQRHFVCLITRIRLCLEPKSTRPILSEVGWLKRQTCFTLALLLIASRRLESYGVEPANHSDSDALINGSIELLANDGLCDGASKIYATTLQHCRAQHRGGAADLGRTEIQEKFQFQVS